MVNDVLANGLIDTGAKHNHINSEFCQSLGINTKNNDDNMSLDLAVQGRKNERLLVESAERRGHSYETMKLFALKNLLWDVILGCEFLNQHNTKVSILSLGNLKDRYKSQRSNQLKYQNLCVYLSTLALIAALSLRKDGTI